jgi:ATP-binding cassette subfamily C protein
VDSSRAFVVLLGGYGPLLALLLTGPGLVGRGAITVGGLVGAATYQTSQILPALRLLTGTVGAYWTQLGVTVSRLAEATRPATRPPAGAAPAGAHDIVVDRVSFAYGPDAEPVLRDLSLTIPPDDHVAIVGASGIGKSTLANILAGLEPPTAGTVRLGGVPIASVHEHTRTRLVALVPQEAYVFPGTVRENLCYLNPRATRPVLEQAIDRLGLTPVVERLGGLDAELVNPAHELSSGERQLMVLTRVYVSPARVVLLDEATCHLDPAAEARAETAFAARPGTLIVIAHRISSARRARRILLLDGQQARYGSHAELLTRSPRYADLVGHWHQPPPVPGPAPVP